MRGTESMGPEAAVLSARIAELRAFTIDDAAETVRDAPLWVEAAVLAARDPVFAEEPPAERPGAWARLRRALRRGEGRGERRPTSGVAALALLAHERR